MSEYVSKYAVCPYYRRHKDGRICCEGTDTTNSINLVFGDKNRLKEYETQYCNRIEGYPKCLVSHALDSKYPK